MPYTGNIYLNEEDWKKLEWLKLEVYKGASRSEVLRRGLRRLYEEEKKAAASSGESTSE
ncbi:MAG: hypothetical protein QXG97_07485 [Nitrososphaerota archaeon]